MENSTEAILELVDCDWDYVRAHPDQVFEARVILKDSYEDVYQALHDGEFDDMLYNNVSCSVLCD